MEMTKSGHRKARLINQKMIQEKLLNNVYNYMVWLRKQQKILIIKFKGTLRGNLIMVMYIMKVSKFDMVKEEGQVLGQQSKNLVSKSRNL